MGPCSVQSPHCCWDGSARCWSDWHDSYFVLSDKLLGTSYGYEPTQYDFANMSNRKVRRLLKVMAHEISSVTFPANPYSSAVAKSGGNHFASMTEADQDMQRLLVSLKKERELATSLEQRQKLLNRLAYDVQTWFNGFEAELQIQQSRQHTAPSRGNTALKDSIARMNDFFNDADLMLR